MQIFFVERISIERFVVCELDRMVLFAIMISTKGK